MIYKGQYKCRLCGEITNIQGIVNNKEEAIEHIKHAFKLEPQKDNPYLKGCYIDLKIFHNCKNESVGISDFIGFKKHDE